MWNPISIKLINFRSFVEQEYYFQKGAFLIQGKNLTEANEAKSNGSGKSSFRESLCYVLGLPTFSDTVTDLVNSDTGAKKCTVYFKMYNDLTKQTLEITRSTPLKGSTILNIDLDGVDQKNRYATVRDGDKLIIELIGISKEDLLNHYIISKEKYTSFFYSSDTKVKELISRFSNFNKVDGVEDIVKSDVDEMNEDLQLLKSEYSKLQGKLELLDDELKKEQDIDVNELKNSRILELQEEINGNNQNIKFLEEKVEIALKMIENLESKKGKVETKLETLQGEMDSLEEISFRKEIEKIKEKKSKTMSDTDTINKSTKEINENISEFEAYKIKAETTIEGAIKCPKCLHEFVPGGELTVEEAKESLPLVIEELGNLSEKSEENKNKLNEIDGILAKYNEEIKGYQAKVDEFNEHKDNLSSRISRAKLESNGFGDDIELANQNIESHKKSIEINKQDIEDFTKKIKEIKKEVIKTREDEIEKSIKEVNAEMLEIEDMIQIQQDKIFDKEQWVHRFKKFKSSLANESLEIIQGYANMHLKNMKSSLSLKLEGYKQNKNGEIREKITPIILRGGVQEGSGNFKRYSGGERGKVDIATSVLAVQSLINNNCSTGGFNLCFIDEITEGVDGLGLENIVKSINPLNVYCLIISHTTHESVYNNIVTIEKKNKVSQIV